MNVESLSKFLPNPADNLSQHLRANCHSFLQVNTSTFSTHIMFGSGSGGTGGAFGGFGQNQQPSGTGVFGGGGGATGGFGSQGTTGE